MNRNARKCLIACLQLFIVVACLLVVFQLVPSTALAAAETLKIVNPRPSRAPIDAASISSLSRLLLYISAAASLNGERYAGISTTRS